MISKILIPTDFSPAAWQAVQYGIGLADKHRAEVTILHVYPSQNKYMSWLRTSGPEDKSAIVELDQKLKMFTEQLKTNCQSSIYYHVSSGHVTQEILNYAKEYAFDLIIMGINSGALHNQPGSNTAEIIRNAGFPVLIIPGMAKAAVA